MSRAGVPNLVIVPPRPEYSKPSGTGAVSRWMSPVPRAIESSSVGSLRVRTSSWLITPRCASPRESRDDTTARPRPAPDVPSY